MKKGVGSGVGSGTETGSLRGTDPSAPKCHGSPTLLKSKKKIMYQVHAEKPGQPDAEPAAADWGGGHARRLKIRGNLCSRGESLFRGL